MSKKELNNLLIFLIIAYEIKSNGRDILFYNTSFDFDNKYVF